MRKFMKNWGTLTVAFFALLASVYAVYSDKINLENTSKLIEERYIELDEQFERQLELQKQLDENQDSRHEATEVALEKRYIDLDEQFERQLELQKQLDENQDSRHEEMKATAAEYNEYNTLNNYLTRLQIRLTDQRIWLSDTPDIVQEYAGRYNTDAGEYWIDADKELVAGNFQLVRELCDYVDANIEKCYEIAYQIAPSPLPLRPLWVEPGLEVE